MKRKLALKVEMLRVVDILLLIFFNNIVIRISGGLKEEQLIYLERRCFIRPYFSMELLVLF